MRYQEAYDYINTFTNYEKLPGLNSDVSSDELERVRLLLRLLGRPQNNFNSIVIAGTKGKGSVAAMLDSILREAGRRTGFYSSPHLHTFRERIRVGGEMISPADMARLVEKIQPIVEHIKALGDPTLVPTTYELATALAFLYFQENDIEIAVLEVGLGGRFDAVNVVEPLVSVITSISMDHMQVLGDSLTAIAGEKAGIIKPHGKVISAPQQEEAMKVINSVAEDRRAELMIVGREIYVGTGHLPEVLADEQGVPIYQVFTIGFESERGTPGGKMRVRLPLLGSHQQINAAVAMATTRVLQEAGIDVNRSAVLEGLAKVHWPGRLEVLRRDPVIIADGAHNVESMAALGQAMNDLFPKRPVIAVIGLSRDKDVHGIMREIRSWSDGLSGPKVDRLIVTRSNHPRAAEPNEVAQQAMALGMTVELRKNTHDALARAQSVANSYAKDENFEPVVLVTGSLFVVAEARSYCGLAPDLGEELRVDG
jgi:dihydrofolate synthase / folylpolyglutamate synthase